MSRLLYGEELAAEIRRVRDLGGVPVFHLSEGQIESLSIEDQAALAHNIRHDPEIVRDTTWEM